MIKKCEECGIEFNARSNNQRFCKGPHHNICAICGVEFEYTCTPADKPHTCSPKCKKEYRKQCLLDKYGVTNVSQIDSVREKKRISNASEEAQRKSKETCLKRYGVERACQAESVKKKLSETLKSAEVREKTRKTFQEHYGVDHIFASPEYRESHGCNTVSTKQSTKYAIKRRLMEKYGVDNIANIPGVKEKAKQAREATCMRKYGENCIFKTKQFQQHIQQEYGVDNISKHPTTLSKSMRNKQNKSNLEIRLHNFLAAYDIEYVEEYVISEDKLVHSFDVYLPKYKILIDVDGEYWHSYLSDPDGDRVREDGDPVRLALVPNDHIFYLIVESDFERGLRGLQKMIQEIDNDIFDYDSHIFNWCRSVGFPYYQYDDARLQHEWSRLQSCHVDEYNENCMFGISIINQFHRSILDAHVPGELSPRQAWDDDKLLKKVIANRLVYQNDVTPSKVLQGFNISKIATKVSVFNPVLGVYLCQKYLQGIDEVFDPFSGFSGRLLGVVATGKHYIGQDLDQTHVTESDAIMQKLHITTASVSQADILSCEAGQYQSLMTCPPYGNKEIYGEESVFKSCDEWIDLCLSKFDCKRYIFVVDNTTKYQNYIAEELKNRSHFRKSCEKVIVIDKELQ